MEYYAIQKEIDQIRYLYCCSSSLVVKRYEFYGLTQYLKRYFSSKNTIKESSYDGLYKTRTVRTRE